MKNITGILAVLTLVACEAPADTPAASAAPEQVAVSTPPSGSSAVTILPDLSSLMWPVAAVLIVFGMIVLAALLLPHLLQLLKKQAAQPEAVDPTTQGVLDAMGQLDQTLARLQRSGDKAALLASDANVQVDLLVQLVKGFALKAADFSAEISILEFAQRAILSGDPGQVAEAAGHVGDLSLSSLMLIETADERLLLAVSKTIANQVGIMRRWEQAYTTFAVRLMADIREAKTRVSHLQSSLDLLSAAEPLAKIQASLGEANRVLQLRRGPDVGRLVESVPTVAARLLRG